MANISSEKLLNRLKGLQAQMREGEHPLFSIPAIWDNATEKQSNACDVVLTNQRLFGYIYTTFPRERLFLDALELDQLTEVSLRQKNFEAVFRELLVSDGPNKVYVRATRKKIEDTYAALQSALAQHAPTTNATLDIVLPDEQQPAPVYSRRQIRQPLDRSPLGITLLLVGGLLVEILGAIAWAATGSMATGLPLFLAGLVAVGVATLARRQMR
ncbi:MAG: hypothetical protein ACRDHW_17415 [Ktedonobacteraceae bacterium]